MWGFLITLLVTAVSLLLIARLRIGVEVDSFGTSLIAALVFGIVNGVLSFFATPFTWITFGLFAIVVNAAAFYLTAALVPGFRVRGVLAALVGSVLLALLNMIIFWIVPG